MATIKEQRDELLDEVKEETRKVVDLYAETIEALTLIIVASTLSYREKTKRVKQKISTAKLKQKSIVTKIVEDLYVKNYNRTQENIKVDTVKLTQEARDEVKNLTDQLLLELEARLAVIQNKSLRSIKKQEQATILRNSNEVDGAKREVSKEKDVEIVFNDSQGRRIQATNSVALVVEDSLWSTSHSAMATVLVHNGYRYVLHKSIIDDRTSKICRKLNNTVRDILKDQLPPMHPNCRSTVKFILDLNFKT